MKNNSAFAVFKIMHRAMLAGQLLFTGAMFYLVYSKKIIPPLPGQDKILQVMAILFAAFAFFGGNSIVKRKLSAIRENTGVSVKEKFEKYRSAAVFQWALLEGAVLFCGVCFFLAGNYAFLALAAVLILLFTMQVPDKSKIALQSGLSITDLEEL